jgi:hypothetical protein
MVRPTNDPYFRSKEVIHQQTVYRPEIRVIEVTDRQFNRLVRSNDDLPITRSQRYRIYSLDADGNGTASLINIKRSK